MAFVEDDVGVVSRVGKTVVRPELRKIPPPTRLGRAVSRACLASLNEDGFSAAGADEGDTDGGIIVFSDGFKGREETSLRPDVSRASFDCGIVVCSGFCSLFGGTSTIWIGTRRRRGGFGSTNFCAAVAA